MRNTHIHVLWATREQNVSYRMNWDKLLYFGLLFTLSCSIPNNENQIDGHWHCVNSELSEFKTIDIADSIITTDKYTIGSLSVKLYLDKRKSEWDNNVKVRIVNDKLTLNYWDYSVQFKKSDLKNCLLTDRYSNSMINLSLPEVESARDYDISVTNFTTGDIFIGKLKQGLNDSTDSLAKHYPDSIFMQVNDVLINHKDITEYVRQLKNCLDCPRENINLHVDKDVPEGVVGTVVKLINPGESRSTIVHNVVKVKKGDIGLLRR